jgi:uncharacterized protein YdeI (YjbR/CyaY-like superfamily)/NTP pyrophosphatase (non-canonical NTP hydrolase)
MSDLAALVAELRAFVAARDWGQFHDPKNLAMLIASEAGELAAEYRWVRGDEADARSREPEARARIAAEAADVGLGLLLLCDRIGLDLVDAMKEKLARNAERYPVDASKGIVAMAASTDSSPTLALATLAAWRAWLRTHHAGSTGVFLRIPKAAAAGARGGLTYAAALEAALAWGWIDGQKRGLDASAWLQRFTPRAPRSGWSKINRAKAEALIAAGAMEAPGLAEVERAKRDGRWERAYDGARAAAVPPDLAAALARTPGARAFFDALDGANRYAILYRVQTAKLPATRARRIDTLVAMCARGETLHPPRRQAAATPPPSRAPSRRRS